MSSIRTLLIAVTASIVVVLSAAAAAAAPPSSTELAGTVKSSSGKPLEGVAVSARADGMTYTTTVYSDQSGQYFFPPLDRGQYKVWAQAVGFETGKSELEISSAKKVQQDFTLKALPDFHKQLSGTEWLESLPNESPSDRRLKQILGHTCMASCHPANFILQNRFDAAGWGKILNFMERVTIRGYMLEGGDPSNPAVYSLVQANKEDLVGYLTRVRGPDPYPLKYKPFPRPTGEAARIVVTEYDLPPGDRPDYYTMNHNGSNWSEGTPSKFDAELAHDMAVDQEGFVWFSDYLSPGRSIGRLDPQTGRVTGYKLADKDGFVVQTHGLVADQKGNMWATNSTGSTEGTILKFDPKTEKFQRFPKPGSLTPGIGPTITVDIKGNLWAVEDNGVFRLNPETGEYTEYKSVTKGGDPYGIAIDAEDNAWFSQIAADRLGIVNGRTGEVSEVVLPPLDEQISDKDREIGARSGYRSGKWSSAGPLYQKGPRRLAADRKGNSVWVAEYWADRLAKIDINSKKVTEYSLPHSYSDPYAVAVDRNHMVWVNLLNSDRLVRFNPYTEQFTEYPLPTLGTGTRFITVDDRTDIPTVWIPYNRVNKIARMQFRTAPGTQ